MGWARQFVRYPRFSFNQTTSYGDRVGLDSNRRLNRRVTVKETVKILSPITVKYSFRCTSRSDDGTHTVDVAKSLVGKRPSSGSLYDSRQAENPTVR